MVFEYSFTRNEYADANAQYMKRMQFVMAILLICLLTIFVVIACVYKFVLCEAYDGNGARVIILCVLYAIFLSCILFAVFFILTFVFRRSTKVAAVEFFNCYNVDGLLNYRVELTETELVIKCRQNVSHVPLSALSKVESLESYAFVLFKTNVLLVVKINDDTELLINSLRDILPTNQ